ncbi:hypothetical protein L1987_53735 [Smallanthus sonchifolius]|uniref:Uncharacterized protein n=1 Tax=Smallanthus sonchifolius TaxID=185202 RepID=A0ACB9EX56_9ASTR|nr:hypothetical protein L1987_53735 [Smallanthus sonchifolius]
MAKIGSGRGLERWNASLPDKLYSGPATKWIKLTCRPILTWQHIIRQDEQIVRTYTLHSSAFDNFSFEQTCD